MHIVNLLEYLLLELILFILKDFLNQNLKNFCNINDIWIKKVNLELSKKKTLFDFQIGSLVQNRSVIKEYYSKLKKYNKSIGYNEKLFKWIFLNRLSSKNKIKVFMNELQALILDKIMKDLSLK